MSEKKKMSIKWIVIMSSDKYREEDFIYESREQALQGLDRLMMSAKIARLKDGVERYFKIRTEVREDEDNSTLR